GYGEGEKEGEPQARLVEILRGLRGDEWGKEVLREYRMLLLGQAGGDGAKEEMARILTQRKRGKDALKKKNWRFFRSLLCGGVIGAKDFVRKIAEEFLQLGGDSIKEVCRGVFAGQKIFRRSEK
ncbi:MAG: hypothetical protein LAT58_00450, partial [Opitutales bacterium]|nr:hypothetical protein [Opitutales bacterium]